MADIGFNLMQLIIIDKVGIDRNINPQPRHFDNLKDGCKFTEKGVYYEVQIIVNEKYIWLAFDSGKPNPRDPFVVDTQTFKKDPNPRTESQTELLDQFFVLFYFPNNTLYLSNNQKKTFLSSFLKEKLNIDILIKSFYKTPNEFIDTIKKVRKITFTDTRNLFNQNSKERQALVDLTGIDAPETFSIEATYNNGIINNFIRRMTENYDNNIVICGQDEEGFECIYNKESFCQKIPIKLKKEDNSKFDAMQVLQALISEIES